MAHGPLFFFYFYFQVGYILGHLSFKMAKQNGGASLKSQTT